MIINFEKIKNYLNISDEEIKALSILEIERIEQEIKEKEIEARKQNPETLDKYKKFFRAYDLFISLFGEELTDKYLITVDFNSLTEEKHYENTPHQYKGFVGEFIKKGYQYIEKYHPQAPEYKKMVNVMCETWLISSQYQGLRHKNIIVPILLEKFPWLDSFKIEVYEIHSGENSCNEFYVKTSCGKSLYVPYTAFLKGDIYSIINRNQTYLNWYYKDNGKSFNELMESKETKQFFNMMTT